MGGGITKSTNVTNFNNEEVNCGAYDGEVGGDGSDCANETDIHN